MTLSDCAQATPATSPAGTDLDYDDDDDTVLDVDEVAAGTDPLDTDTDDDGDDDANDQFPLNSAEWDDTDGDAPAGSDGTGYGDNSDAFPTDACANVDTDGDGQPDDIISGCTTTLTLDVDDDGDGVGDAYDAFPLDATETTDTDGDGTGNNADTDDDDDMWPDDHPDWAPLDSSEWIDSDGDGIGNNADADDDNDGTPDGDDTYPYDYDNDGWGDAFETACGSSPTSALDFPADNDADTVGTSASVDSSGAPSGANLCDAIDDDDDNDGYLDIITTLHQLCGDSTGASGGSSGQPTAVGNYLTVTSSDDDSNGDGYDDAECTFTLPAGASMDIVIQTKGYGGEGGVIVTDPSGTSTTFNGFSSYSYYTLNSDGTMVRQGSYSNAGSTESSPAWTSAGAYTINYYDSYGDGCNPSSYSGDCWVQASYTSSTGNDKFQFDYEAWFDTDDDGLTDYISPDSTVIAYTTVHYCTGDSNNYLDNWYDNSYTTYPDQPVGGYIAVHYSDTDSDGDGDDDAECTFTVGSGEIGSVTLNTGSWGTEAYILICEHVSWGLNCVGTGNYYSDGNYNVANLAPGTYTLYYNDEFGDGCNPSPSYGVCWVQVQYTYVSGTTVPDITTYGTSVDNDDDGDGYSDVDEGDAYDTGTAALCDDGSAYASSSDSLDASSTPADMDGDLICDALDTDRDGDGYANADDAFPDDLNEWTDTDSDGTGDNTDTDDDADGTLDVDDAFPLDECADTDSDGDGRPDSMTAGCSSTLELDSDDDDDGVVDHLDAFPDDEDEWTDTDGDGTGDNTDDDDDGDGTPDTIDAFPLNVCASDDFDDDGMPDDFLSANCGATIATVSFEQATAESGYYTDTGNSSVDHALANNADESDVNYNGIETLCSIAAMGYTGSSTDGITSCTFTLGEGNTLEASIMHYFGASYQPISLMGPSGHYLINHQYTNNVAANLGGDYYFYEAGEYTFATHQSMYTDYGYSLTTFHAQATGPDLPYAASYISTGGVGLTDGDYFGVTDYTGTVGAFTDGSQGYQMSDTDGITQLTFEGITAPYTACAITTTVGPTGSTNSCVATLPAGKTLVMEFGATDSYTSEFSMDVILPNATVDS